MGAGQGGVTMAADLTLRGYEVRLFELQQFRRNLDVIQEKSGVDLKGEGLPAGKAKVSCLTVDAREAIQDADFIAVAVPCFGHEEFSRLIVENMKEEQTVCFFGEGSGSLVFMSMLRRLGIKRVVVGETNTLQYLTRVVAGEVKGRMKKGGVLASALPSSNNEKLLPKLKEFYPFIEPAEDVIETVTLNFNAIDHVSTFILNLGTIEGSIRDMRFWGEGATPSVVRVIDAVDHECMMVRQAYGSRNTTPFREWIYRQGFNDSIKPDTYTAIHSSTHQEQSTFRTGPEARFHRYLTEDAPYAMVLISELGRLASVKTPVIDAHVTLASAFNETDYWKEGRTLKKLGLEGMTANQLREYVRKGTAA
jgi:opine dehydrogenase